MFDRALNRHMCISCLLLKKKYFRVGKQIITDKTNMKLAKK